MPLLNQLLNPNLQVLRSWLVHHDMFYMSARCFETPGSWVGWLVGWWVGGLVGWLFGWLVGCVSLQDANLTIQVILEMFLSRLRMKQE